MSDIVFPMFVMFMCLAAEAFFSGSEIAVVSADRIKLRHDAAKGSRGAKLALKMLENPEWLLSTTLVGTNISVVTNTTMATAMMIELFGSKGSVFAVVLVAPLIWVFGEIVPKSVFQQRADAITPRAIFILKFFSYLFFPILIVFSSAARLLSRVVGGRVDHENPFTLREQILTMMQMSGEESDIEPIEKKMIRRLFNFGETSAGEVMVPLIDVVSIEKGASCGQAVQLATSSAHKRLPVHDERVDRIVGVLNSLELLGVDPDQPIEPFIRPPDYVPASRSVQDLLIDLRHQGDVMAVVVDEYGGTEGILTIEDIMEEVVEEMQDEYDANEVPTQWIKRVGEREFLASARLDLDTLGDKLRIELPRGKYTSVAGFLLEKFQDVPPRGARIDYKGVVFTVEDATPQAIKVVRVRL